MLIGFTNETQTVDEGTLDSSLVFVEIATERDSEQLWEIEFRHVDIIAENIAIVKAFTYIGTGFDAQFGAIDQDPLTEPRRLIRGEKTISPIRTQIINDFLPESTECFKLSISFVPSVGIKEGARCDDVLGYFCIHTICILDNDGKVSF